jgi:uncharacterized protein
VIYEWNSLKGAGNLAKHGVSFGDAASVFLDPLAMTFPDPDHSLEERRKITIGLSKRRRLLFVAHCERRGRMRIISARPATRMERKQYAEGIGEDIG